MTRNFKLGLIARGDTGGLAAQTWDFFRHMQPDKVMLIDIDGYTGQRTDYTRYEGAENLTIITNYPTPLDFSNWLGDLDVVFTVECPYDHSLYEIARQRGVKTVCQYNWEFLQHHQEPDLPTPDLWLSPSSWKQPDTIAGVPVKYIHVPVDRERFPFSLHPRAKKFLHIAGHRTFGDRNGTATLLESLPYIQSDIEITLRTQDDLPRAYTDHKLKIIHDDVRDNTELYNNEDVLILPRRYGGLSLQLNEALSLGMPVIMLDIEPQASMLPKSWLIPAKLQESIYVKTRVDVYGCPPDQLAKKIDWFSKQPLARYSKKANALASERDWKVMRPQYEALLEILLH